MALASGVTLEIEVGRVRFLPGALDYARQGALPGGLKNNREFASCAVEAARRPGARNRGPALRSADFRRVADLPAGARCRRTGAVARGRLPHRPGGGAARKTDLPAITPIRRRRFSRRPVACSKRSRRDARVRLSSHWNIRLALPALARAVLSREAGSFQDAGALHRTFRYGRGQQQLLPSPHGKCPRHLARFHPGQIPLRGEGQPVSHPHETAEGSLGRVSRSFSSAWTGWGADSVR